MYFFLTLSLIFPSPFLMPTFISPFLLLLLLYLLLSPFSPPLPPPPPSPSPTSSVSLSPTSTLAVVGTLRTEPVARREKPDGGWPFPRCEGRDHVAGLPSLFPSFPLLALSPSPFPLLYISLVPSFLLVAYPPPLICAFLFSPPSFLSPFRHPSSPSIRLPSFSSFLIALPPSLLLSFYAFLFPSTLRLIAISPPFAFSPSFPYFFFLFLSITSSFRLPLGQPIRSSCLQFLYFVKRYYFGFVFCVSMIVSVSVSDCESERECVCMSERESQ